MSDRSRRAIVWTLFAFAVPFGLDAALGDERSIHLLLLRLAFHILCAWWCFADAKARGFFLGWPGRLVLVLFGTLALLFYLVWSRGWRGLRTAVLVSLVWLAICYAAFFLAGYLKYGNAWFG